MARLQLLVVATLWLYLTLHVIRRRRQSRPDRRFQAALETLRSWQVPPHQPQ